MFSVYDIILSFITAFLLTYVVIPAIIRISIRKRLFDVPGERRVHTRIVPNLGGIGIFAGLIFSLLYWTPFQSFSQLQYILCALVLIFLIGAKDDIIPMSPDKKFLGQIAAACILVFKADIRLTSLHGIFGIDQIPDLVSYGLSIFTILVINNGLNLIDGINGLAGSLSLVICTTFGVWFYLTGNHELSVLAFAMSGAVVAFLRYNFSPAKIFMGDTGSLLIGLISSILAIQFIELNSGLKEPFLSFQMYTAPAVAMGILIIPLFDTLRVFTLRFLKGKSPFHPDKTHLHHLLLDLGLSHMKATGILVSVNVVFILFVFLLQRFKIGQNNLILILILLALALLGSFILQQLVNRTKKLSA